MPIAPAIVFLAEDNDVRQALIERWG